MSTAVTAAGGQNPATGRRTIGSAALLDAVGRSRGGAEHLLPPARRAAATADPQPVESISVLLVEDSPSDALIVQDLLTLPPGPHCDVTVVASLAEARLHLRAGDADCVLLDLSLPDAEGMETVERVLTLAPELPIVVLSGLSDERVTMAALREGAQDYLVKGRVDGPLLWRAIRYAIERKAGELALRRLALHDALTGLGNRLLLLDRVGLALSRLARGGGAVALFMIDLDGFKWVNDSLGHEAGDELLVEVARRLDQSVRDSDLVARIGGDEFVILCESVGSEVEAAAVAGRIHEALLPAFRLPGAEDVRISASVGVVVCRDPAARAEDLLRDADVAMYRAKAHGKACSEIFDTQMRQAVRSRLEAETRLRKAVAAGSFTVHYQPVVRLTDRRVVGAEALVRWPQPDGTLLHPGCFIHLAEETGAIVAIGDHVMREACRTIASGLGERGRGGPFLMHVNLSARQLADRSLPARFVEIAHEHRVEPSWMRLEITETALAADEAATLETVVELKERGFGLCIDDFGTGYASLSYLTRFPVDAIKIDRSFVSGLGRRAPETAVIEAVVALGRRLRISVIAEGVETEQEARNLVTLGCLEAQGYLFGIPAPPGADWPRRRSQRAAAEEQCGVAS